LSEPLNHPTTPLQPESLDAPGTLVAIALGANLGEPAETFARAIKALDQVEGFALRATSRLYVSKPWGDEDQPEFTNAALIGAFQGSPRQLLEQMQRIERELGKEVVRENGPRVIDLDLLLFGDEVSTSADLELPHSRMRARPFVLLPLRDALEIARTRVPLSWMNSLQLSDDGRALLKDTEEGAADALWPAMFLPARSQWSVATEDAMLGMGAGIGRSLRGGERIGLAGPLGAGKSTFVRGLARGLGIDGPVPSPTYQLCRHHEGRGFPLHHWDFYRLEDEDDLLSAGWEDDEKARDAVVAAEWADYFPHLFATGDGVVYVEIDRSDSAGDVRRVSLSLPPGDIALRARIAGELMPL